MPGHTNRVIYFDHSKPINTGVAAKHSMIKQPNEPMSNCSNICNAKNTAFSYACERIHNECKENQESAFENCNLMIDTVILK